MDFSKEIDYSSLSDYILCPRKFFFRHILCLTPDTIPSLDLVFGQAFHFGLEKAHQAWASNPELSALDLTTVASECLNLFWESEAAPWFDSDASFPKSPGRAADMFHNYFQRFYDSDKKGKILGVETPFTINLGLDLPDYIGRLDLPIEFDGWLYIYEHKTSKYVSDTTIAGFENSLQAEGYLTAGYLYYDKIPRVLYNIFLCQKTKIDFTRHQVTRRKEAIDRFLLEVSHHAAKINFEIAQYEDDLLEGRLDSKTDILPYFLRANATLACTNYFRKCPYFDLCMMRNNPALWRNNPPQGFKIEEWNPREHEKATKERLKEKMKEEEKEETLDA